MRERVSALVLGKVSLCLLIIFMSDMQGQAKDKDKQKDKVFTKMYQDVIVDWYKAYAKKGIAPADYKDDTLAIFFNGSLEKCDKVNSTFYTVAYPYKGAWICENYNVPGKYLQDYCVFSDKELTTLNGMFYKFHSDGKLQTSGTLVSNKREGWWLEFNTDGHLVDSCYYHNGMPTGSCYSFTETGGKAKIAVYDTLGNGSGAVNYYYENGALKQTGLYAQGVLRDSLWRYYYPNGSISFEETFSKGLLMETKCFNKDGTLKDSCQAEVLPQFPGGKEALYKFLNKNIKWPSQYQFTNTNSARVIAKFVVEIDGSITNIDIVRHVAKPFDDEVIRVIKKMPRWSPGVSYGNPVKVYYLLPVSFRQ